MKRYARQLLLLVGCLAYCLGTWAYDENNPHEYTNSAGSENHVLVWYRTGSASDLFVNPDHPTVQTMVCYKDIEGYDSWLDNNKFSIRINHQHLLWAWKEGTYVSFDYPEFGYSGTIYTYDMGHQGSDRYFSEVNMFFKYLPVNGSDFALGFYGNYNQNRDGWHWCGRSYQCSIGYGISNGQDGYMYNKIRINGVNGGVGPHRAMLNLTDDQGWKYPHALILSKSPFSDHTWQDPSKEWRHIRNNATDGRTSYDFEYEVENDFEPTAYYIRYYVNGKNDSYFYGNWLGKRLTPYYQRADAVTARFDQWTKRCSLAWERDRWDEAARTNGHWMVLRSTDGTHYSYVGSTKAGEMTFTDTSASNLPYDTQCTYKVAFVPTEWGDPSSGNWEQLLSEELSSTCTCTMARSFVLSELQAEGSDDASFTLTWLTDPIGMGGTGAFQIWRKDSYSNRWEEVSSLASKREQTEWKITDRLDISAARAYSYYVAIEMLDTTFTSEVITHQRLQKPDGVASLKVSKGTYSGSVHLDWTARQSGNDAVTYTLMRRPAGMDGLEPQAWTRLYTTRGIDSNYTYTDQSLSNGVFYEYMVISEAKAFLDNGVSVDSVVVSDYGFASLKGTISGQITYGNGTTVAGARVSLNRKTDDGTQAVKNHSMRSDGGGICWKPDKEAVKDWFRGKDWTVQFFVRPDKRNNFNISPILRMGTFQLSYLTSNDTLGLMWKDASMADAHLGEEVNIRLEPDAWNLLTVTYTKDRKVSVGVINGLQSGYFVQKISKTLSEDPFADSNLIVLGGPSNNGFYGNLDDVRIFGSRALTSKEAEEISDRMLSGNERNLVVYWPLDEGITLQREAYDYSTNAGAANENHGLLLPGTKVSDFIPSDEMLDFYAITDADGNYIIRGIPFAGSGTNYTVTPSLLSHTFSPASQDRFVSANSLVYSGTDFTDVSSFPVTVSVTYDGTSYPVDGVSVAIDGTPVGKDGEMLKTDIDGNVIVDVPIGGHYITVSRNGHTFAAGGRYPEKGTHAFTSKASLRFYDTTTATFAGRIVGGTNNNHQPLGFAQSVNLIGQTRIRLHVSRDGVGINNDNATGRAQSTPRSFGLPQQKWLTTSTATSSSATTIDIITDRQSGEFAVALPPVQYTVESVQVIGDTEGTIRFTDIPPLDLTDVTRTTTDSLETGGSMQHFEYHRSMTLIHRTAPEVEVTPKGQNWFGEQVITKYDADTDTDYTITCYDPDAPEGTNPYVFGYPIYRQLGTYRMKVKAFERYHNFDTGVDKQDPLTTASVKIDNGLSDSCWVSVEDGAMALIASDTIRLDSLGQAEYRFRAGIPNITAAEGFVLPMKVYCRVDGETIPMNDIPNLDGIVLGCLPVPGSNFVTAGPDFVDMVLRDPPGNGSHATWRSGSTISTTTETAYSDKHSDLFNIHGSYLPTFQYSTGLPGWSVTTTICPKFTIDGKTVDSYVTDTINGCTRTTTAIEDISTASDAQWDGPEADVFIGTSTNRLFCTSHVVDLRRQPDGQWKVSVKDEITDGLQFTTDFRYTAWEIKNQQIPKLRSLRNSLILEPGEWSEDRPNTTDHMIYWSPKLTSADEGFGEKDNYKPIRPVDTSKLMVLSDSVDWYNICIANWENRLRDNERDKVLAFAQRDKYLNRNLSISDGVREGNTIRSEVHTWQKTSSDTISYIDVVMTAGVTVCNVGAEVGIGDAYDTQYRHTQVNDTTTFNEFSYEMVTKGLGNSLTVDIYDPSKSLSPDDSLFVRRNFSPIFRTRGGATAGYHEHEYLAEYYEPEKHHLVMEGTVQIHVPEITGTDGVYQYTGIPTESAAIIKLTLKNLSGIGQDDYYTLFIDPLSNPEGANYTVDGVPVEQGLKYYLRYGVPQNVTVECRQTDPDILEYNPVFVLLDPDQPSHTGLYEPIYDGTRGDKAIHIEFARVSSAIDLSCEASRVNASTPGCKVPVTLSGYNTRSTRLRSISLEYYNAALDTWTTLQGWTRDTDADPTLQPLAADATSITTYIDFNDAQFLTDRTYRFRAATTSWFGSEKAVTYSDEISIVKDMEAPHVMAFSPADGIMHAGTEVSVTFNEDIDESISRNNVHLRGVLASQPVEHEVSLNTNAVSLRSMTPVSLSEGTGTITLWMKRMKSLAANINLLAIEGENNLQLHVKDGKLVAAFGQYTYESQRPLPDLGVWTYLSVAFERDAETGVTTFSIGYVTDDEAATLIAPTTLREGCGVQTGRLVLGPSCRFHDVCVWDDYRPVNEFRGNAFTQKKASTPHLLAHWPMDVLHGRVAKDQIGSNNIPLSDDADWAVERVNHAVSGDANIAYQIPLNNCSTTDGEDYHIQYWYRFNACEKGATILSFGDNRGRTITIEADSITGEPYMRWKGGKSLLGVASDLGGASWYRFDFVAEKSLDKGAILYLDGKPSSLVPLSATPNLEGWLTFGGKGASSCIDEIRIWRRVLDAESMEQSMYTALNPDLTDVCLYYPFEEVVAQEGPEKSYAFTLHNVVNPSPASDIRVMGASEPIVESINVPPVKGAPEVTGVSFTLSRSERKFILHIDEPQQNIEGCTLYAQVEGLKDKSGNIADEDVMWSFQVALDNLRWNDAALSLCSTETDEQTILDEGLCTQTASFVNNSSATLGWYITGLPSWLEANMLSGNLKPGEQQTIRFRATGSTLTGTHAGKIYLTEAETGISHSLPYSMSYLPDRPDWQVDRTDIPNTMNIIGQVTIANVIQSNEHSMLAAFDRYDRCAGVCNVEPVDDYGSSFVQMTVYGNSAETDSLTFRYYDAGTGTLYPVMMATRDGKPLSIHFTPDDVLGSFVQPIIFSTTSLIRQTISRDGGGWDYFSFFVHPQDDDVTRFLDGASLLPAEGLSLRIVHDDGFALYEDGLWLTDGTFTHFAIGTAYKLWTSAPFATHYVGEKVSALDSPITIVPGWNWLGACISSRMPLAQALSLMKSQEGDFIKDYHASAICERVTGSVRWQGKLTALTPGGGYLYRYLGSTPFTFAYPDVVWLENRPQQAPVVRSSEPSPALYYGNLDTHASAGVMPVVAQVRLDGEPVLDCEVAAFDDDNRLCGEARPVEAGSQGIILLLLHGDGEQQMRLEVILPIDGKMVTVPMDVLFTYSEGTLLGTVAEPYVLNLTSQQISEITGIRPMAEGEGNLPRYDTSGRRILQPAHHTITLTTEGKVLEK